MASVIGHQRSVKQAILRNESMFSCGPVFLWMVQNMLIPASCVRNRNESWGKQACRPPYLGRLKSERNGLLSVVSEEIFKNDSVILFVPAGRGALPTHKFFWKDGHNPTGIMQVGGVKEYVGKTCLTKAGPPPPTRSALSYVKILKPIISFEPRGDTQEATFNIRTDIRF